MKTALVIACAPLCGCQVRPLIRARSMTPDRIEAIRAQAVRNDEAARGIIFFPKPKHESSR